MIEIYIGKSQEEYELPKNVKYKLNPNARFSALKLIKEWEYSSYTHTPWV